MDLPFSGIATYIDGQWKESAPRARLARRRQSVVPRSMRVLSHPRVHSPLGFRPLRGFSRTVVLPQIGPAFHLRPRLVLRPRRAAERDVCSEGRFTKWLRFGQKSNRSSCRYDDKAEHRCIGQQRRSDEGPTAKVTTRWVGRQSGQPSSRASRVAGPARSSSVLSRPR